ncbi:7011_t:CDS:1, partial [Dentiscutata erythropus]
KLISNQIVKSKEREMGERQSESKEVGMGKWKWESGCEEVSVGKWVWGSECGEVGVGKWVWV